MTQPSEVLELFDNPQPDRDYTVNITITEFTCLYPKNGQPDFATLYLEYVPDQKCIELKSLKLYIWSYRDQGMFHEAAINKITDDLVKACQPRFLRISADFNMRDGIYTKVVADYKRPGWEAPKIVTLP